MRDSLLTGGFAVALLIGVAVVMVRSYRPRPDPDEATPIVELRVEVVDAEGRPVPGAVVQTSPLKAVEHEGLEARAAIVDPKKWVAAEAFSLSIREGRLAAADYLLQVRAPGRDEKLFLLLDLLPSARREGGRITVRATLGGPSAASTGK